MIHLNEISILSVLYFFKWFCKNLSVIFLTNMSLDRYISSIVRSCLLKLHNFQLIRPFISITAATTIANAFVHLRLDFSNSLFYSLPKYSIHRLQKVQNTIARIVTNSSCFLKCNSRSKIFTLASNILSNQFQNMLHYAPC